MAKGSDNEGRGGGVSQRGARVASSEVIADASRKTSRPKPDAGVTGLGGGLAPGVAEFDPQRFGPIGGNWDGDATPRDETYRDAGRSMLGAGVTHLGGGLMPSAPTHRETETASMRALYDYEKEVVGVVDAGAGWTQVELRDGTIETRRGDRASRNFNPGNIEYGRMTRAAGAIGSDGRFAVFPSREQGIHAVYTLLASPSYQRRTVAEAIGQYAPPHENDTARYTDTVAGAAGVTADTRLSAMTGEQIERMVHGMIGVEGNTGYRTRLTGLVRDMDCLPRNRSRAGGHGDVQGPRDGIQPRPGGRGPHGGKTYRAAFARRTISRSAWQFSASASHLDQPTRELAGHGLLALSIRFPEMRYCVGTGHRPHSCSDVSKQRPLALRRAVNSSRSRHAR